MIVTKFPKRNRLLENFSHSTDNSWVCSIWRYKIWRKKPRSTPSGDVAAEALRFCNHNFIARNYFPIMKEKKYNNSSRRYTNCLQKPEPVIPIPERKIRNLSKSNLFSECQDLEYSFQKEFTETLETWNAVIFILFSGFRVYFVIPNVNYRDLVGCSSWSSIAFCSEIC